MKICTKDYIGVYGRCRECGGDVSFYRTDAELRKARPQARKCNPTDWWVACDNEKCDNHQGEGIVETRPKWVKGNRP